MLMLVFSNVLSAVVLRMVLGVVGGVWFFMFWVYVFCIFKVFYYLVYKSIILILLIFIDRFFFCKLPRCLLIVMTKKRSYFFLLSYVGKYQ